MTGQDSSSAAALLRAVDRIDRVRGEMNATMAADVRPESLAASDAALPDAIDLGLDAALPPVLELESQIGEFGRGERI